MAQKDCEGQCPYCGSDNINFNDVMDSELEWISEGWVCANCNRDFIVMYDIITTYSVTEYEEIPLEDKTLWDK